MLDKMAENFLEESDRQAYIEAQNSTIVKQSKKISELEAEIANLKSAAAFGSGLILSASPIDHAFSINDEETIARSQLNKLKSVSLERELTLEEARKLEIYSKIINQIENRPSKKAIPTKVLSTDDLVKSLNSGDE